MSMHTIKISGTAEDVNRAVAALAAIGIKADEVTHLPKSSPQHDDEAARLADAKKRIRANELFEAWRNAAYAEEQAFPDTPEEATAMVATTRAYEALITHLDDNGLTGRWWDPRGSNEEFEGAE